jgi:hypothetical protein
MLCSLLEKEPCCAGRIHHSVINDAQTTGHSRAQIRFGFCDVCTVENFYANTALAVAFLFAMNFGHFFFVGSEPERAAWIIFNIGGELWNKLPPECPREVG